MPPLPDPLHPVVVHFPIVLAALLPWIALGVPLATARGWLPRRAWAGVVLAAALVAGAGWMAEETGELTPTLKVKRKVVTARFEKELDALYEEKLA